MNRTHPAVPGADSATAELVLEMGTRDGLLFSEPMAERDDEVLKENGIVSKRDFVSEKSLLLILRGTDPSSGELQCRLRDFVPNG